MGNSIVAICPTLERLDLVRQMVGSYNQTAGETAPPLLMIVEGQDDGTEGWCRNQGLSVLRLEQATPFAKAINLAASQVKADWLLLLNNDLILQPGFWAGIAAMAANGYDCCGAKLLYPKGTIQHFGKWFTYDGYPFHVLRHQPGDHPMTLQPRPFPSVTFACVAIKRELWDELKGLDETFENGYEDDDFCLRAREIGAGVGVHPGALAVHLESQTTGRDTANKQAQWERFQKRWCETGRIQWATGVYQGWKQP